MTKVEFSRLVADLAKTAEELNRESDSINDLIERFEEQLRNLNLGIEEWADRSLEEALWEEERGEDHEGYPLIARGTHDIELGFVKYLNKWQLSLRRTTWQYDDPDRSERPRCTSREAPHERLLDASRNLRIAALEALPSLVQRMQERAKDALATIQRAKAFVKE